MKNKIKVLWLCGFCTPFKQSQLSLWRKVPREGGMGVTNLLRGFINDSDYEIHVVSTQVWMKKAIERYSSEGVYYHCFQSGAPFLGDPGYTKFDQLTNFYLVRRRIKKIIKAVNPDLIHLFGAENPQYASGVLDLPSQLPVLVTIQGFVNRQSQYFNDFVNRVRCKYEKMILKKCCNYMGDYDSEKYLRSITDNVKQYTHLYFPVNEDLISRTPQLEKKYDILFAGHRTAAKGFPDYLKIIGLLKEKYPGLKAGVIGTIEDYPPAKTYVQQSCLEDNLEWLGSFPDQTEVFKIYTQTRIFLAPTYNDAFASTIRECMLLGTPVISYKTGGIPYANRNGKENVVIVEQGDVNGMATQVLDLLLDEKWRVELADRALKFARDEFSMERNVGVIKDEYDRLLGHTVLDGHSFTM